MERKNVNMELKVARVRNNWTQDELAKRSGISRRTLRLIENGESSPTIKVAAQICKALGVTDIAELFQPNWDDVVIPEYSEADDTGGD
jgi:putative transcriptional regulator